ncbi:MAG: alginate lyase family protein [Planctomycetota bacterium]
MGASRYYHTLKHLTADQWWWQMKYRIWRKWFPLEKKEAPSGLAGPRRLPRRCRFLWPPISEKTCLPKNRFRLINETVTFEGEVDWSARTRSRLWAYQLNAFDFLGTASIRDGTHMIREWIKQCNSGIGWEPAPTSCRMMNWIKFLADRVPDAFDRRFREEAARSLFVQADWLSQNTERHIRGNHLLKNGAALIFAGAHLNHDAFLQQGESLLEETVNEQFLADGGHDERSPMYHALVLFDMLDCLNLTVLSDPVRRLLETRVKQALNFLVALCHGDGEIALFNDSVFHMAPRPGELVRYAREVAGIETPPRPEGASLFFPDSGYTLMNAKECSLIADAGPVGPDYFPAHAHCDLLSFELSVGPQRIIVDSGNYDYNHGEMREYTRSTRAHNTVVVDHRNQSDMWDIFRVGQRARVVSAELFVPESDCILLRASHDGYESEAGVRHVREIIRFRQGFFLIIDRLEGTGEHRVSSYLHFHPDCIVTQGAEGAKSLTLDAGGKTVYIHSGLTHGRARLETGWYCPEFHVRREQTVLAVYLDGSLPTTLVTCLGTHCKGPVSVDLQKCSLQIGDESYGWTDMKCASPEREEAACAY